MTATLALIKANHVKAERARLLHELYWLPARKSHQRAIRLLEAIPAELRTLRLELFLSRIRVHEPSGGSRRVCPAGRSANGPRVDRILAMAGVEGSKRLGELSGFDISQVTLALRLATPRGKSSYGKAPE